MDDKGRKEGAGSHSVNFRNGGVPFTGRRRDRCKVTVGGGKDTHTSAWPTDSGNVRKGTDWLEKEAVGVIQPRK